MRSRPRRKYKQMKTRIAQFSPAAAVVKLPPCYIICCFLRTLDHSGNGERLSPFVPPPLHLLSPLCFICCLCFLFFLILFRFLVDQFPFFFSDCFFFFFSSFFSCVDFFFRFFRILFSWAFFLIQIVYTRFVHVIFGPGSPAHIKNKSTPSSWS